MSGKRKEFRYFNKVEELAKQGNMHPLEFLQLVMNGDWQKLGYENKTETRYSKDGTPYEIDVISLDHRIDAARNLAPYVAPRLSAVKHTVEKKDSVLKEVEAIVQMPTDQLLQEINRLTGLKGIEDGIERGQDTGDDGSIEIERTREEE